MQRITWGVILASTLLAAGSGCRQQVIVYECPDGGHDGSDAQALDAATLDAAQLDAGELDAGSMDAEVPDAGRCSPFCFTGLQVSAPVVDVREPSSLTPEIEVAAGVDWEVRVDATDVVAVRAEGRPPLDFDDVPIDVTVANREVVFRVQDVPPWFLETRFVITVHVREVGRAVEQTQTAEVVVRGNVIMSTGSDGKVYAAASDGNPATGEGRFPNGVLLDQLVTAPRAMRLLRDGSLLVFDQGASPIRIIRFEMSGTDVLLEELQYLDDTNQPLFRSENNTVYGFTELPDGRVVLPEYQFSGNSGAPKSRLMIWKPDRTFDREVWAPTASENWRAAEVSSTGDLLVVDRGLDQVTRYNATTWAPDGVFLDSLPGTPYSLRATEDALYVAGYAYMVQVPWAGGRAAINGLPGASSIWRAVAPYEGGRILAVRDTQSAQLNVALLDNRQYERWFRTENAGPIISIFGLEYLK